MNVWLAVRPRRHFVALLASLCLAGAVVACSFDTPVAIDPPQIPEATVGVPYIVTFTAATTYPMNKIYVEDLPPDMAFDYEEGNTATISGTPTTPGSYQFKVIADGMGMNFGHPRGERAYTLVVR